MCANVKCKRSNNYNPLNWSKSVKNGTNVSCKLCEKCNINMFNGSYSGEGGGTYESDNYCSIDCFKACWADHAAKHAELLNKTVSSNNLAMLSGGSVPSANGSSGTEIKKIDSITEITTDMTLIAPTEDVDNMIVNTTSVVVVNGANSSKDVDNTGWVEIAKNTENFVPSSSEVGHVLRLVLTAVSKTDSTDKLAGPIILYTEPVLSSPACTPRRDLVKINGVNHFNETKFRIISYNILAELYATRQMYAYCDAWSLLWPYRRSIILKEIQESAGDVICLQEVQVDHYEKDLLPFMQRLGYDGQYKQKSRESMGQYGKIDGCATFWNLNKFSLLENYSLEFNDYAVYTASEMNLSEHEYRKVVNQLNRDNIAQIIILEGRTRANLTMSLCVVNTHLYSNYQRPDVKLWQTIALIREIEQYLMHREIPLIICGDFNSEPHSSVYEFLSRGIIEKEYSEFKNQKNNSFLPEKNDIYHNFKLASAMEKALNSEPKFTNYTKKFKGTLDYIWYTPLKLSLKSYFRTPDESELRVEGLPSTQYPSDHIMLICDVAFKQYD